MYEIWDQKSTENSFLLRSCQVIAPQSGFPAYFLFRFFSELCENLFYLLNKIKTNLVFIELRRDPIFGFCSSYASQEFKQFLGRFVGLRPSICPFSRVVAPTVDVVIDFVRIATPQFGKIIIKWGNSRFCS